MSIACVFNTMRETNARFNSYAHNKILMLSDYSTDAVKPKVYRRGRCGTTGTAQYRS